MNILVTNFDNSGDDVMVFTNMFTPNEIEKKLIEKNKSFEDIYEVSSSDLQYYIFEPCWI